MLFGDSAKSFGESSAALRQSGSTLSPTYWNLWATLCGNSAEILCTGLLPIPDVPQRSIEQASRQQSWHAVGLKIL